MQEVTPLVSKPYPTLCRAWYAVGVLTVASIFKSVDAAILSLLVAPIRHDLHISDTQISLLMGMSVTVFYAFLGIPIGWLADSHSRRNIMVTGIAAWSLFTAGCGLVSTFGQLFFARVGVGVGEAALSPPALSAISDYFVPRQRALAISVYGVGNIAGYGVAFLLGAIIAAHTSSWTAITFPAVGLSLFPWQLTFLIVGLPGLLIAAMVLTIREPERRERRQAATHTFRDTLAFLRKNRVTIACHHSASTLSALAGTAIFAWTPTFFIRVHHVSTSRVGLIVGTEIAVVVSLGVLAGGWLCNSLIRRGCGDAHFRIGWIFCLAILPAMALFPFISSTPWAFIDLIIILFLHGVPLGVSVAALQQVAPNQMRGQLSAIFQFVFGLLGLSVGATAVALITDHVFRNDQMLGYSLSIVCTSSYLVAALIWRVGSKPFAKTLHEAQMFAGRNE